MTIEVTLLDHDHFKNIILSACEGMIFYQPDWNSTAEVGAVVKNPWFRKAFPEIDQFVLSVASQVESRPMRTQYWINKYPKGTSQDLHIHTEDESCILSWVYLVEVPPGTSDLVLVDNGHETVYNTEGTIVFFSPKQWHYVTENLSSETRITLAGNIILC